MNLPLSDLPKRDHVAIMKKSRKLIAKILSGEKTIESRWYVNRICPWDQINAGDTVYFKDSGEPVTVKANVFKVLQFKNLSPRSVKNILKTHGKGIGMELSEKNIRECATKNYCILIFLEDVHKVAPFKIDKTGYGLMSAWITVDDINKIKRQE